MMRRKSTPSEIILEIIKSNNSFSFLKNWEREIISFLSKYHFVLLLHVYSNKSGKLSKTLFISLTLKFAILTHHCNLRTKIYNGIFKTFKNT